MFLLHRYCPLLAGVVLAHLPFSASAHPIPDIPVRGVFESGGAATIYVEVNPRSFEADANDAPSLINSTYQTLPPERKAELKRLAAEFVPRSVEFYLEPVGRMQPEFTF